MQQEEAQYLPQISAVNIIIIMIMIMIVFSFFFNVLPYARALTWT